LQCIARYLFPRCLYPWSVRVFVSRTCEGCRADRIARAWWGEEEKEKEKEEGLFKAGDKVQSNVDKVQRNVDKVQSNVDKVQSNVDKNAVDFLTQLLIRQGGGGGGGGASRLPHARRLQGHGERPHGDPQLEPADRAYLEADRQNAGGVRREEEGWNER